MRNFQSLLLLSLSVVLVGTWTFHLYDKALYSNRKTVVYIKDTVAARQATRDSLQKIYSATIHDLPPGLDSMKNNPDSIKASLNNQWLEVYSLNKAIDDLLKKDEPRDTDMVLAAGKIIELQQKVAAFRDSTIYVKEEKKKLNELLEQLTAGIKELEQNMKGLDIKK